MQNELTRHLDSYELALTPMTHEDVPRLHELSISVNWPHRPHDWEFLLGLGEGVVARDQIGRILGSAMWFPMGDRLATAGMLITSPRLQDQGAGRWLMDHIIEQAGSRAMTLTATKAAYRLHLSLDFQPWRSVYQHNGIVAVAPKTTSGVSELEDGDLAGVLELDRLAFGADRSSAYKALLEVSAGTVLRRDGLISGFALCRRFGRGYVIGPVVAESEEDAVALIRPHIAAHAGEFVRMDTREEEDGPIRRLLVESGIRLHDRVTTMTRGDMPARSDNVFTFGLISQALG